MSRINRSGFSLVFAGIVGLLFFWLTDPRLWLGRWLVGEGLDATNDSRMGTIVGVAGSGLALLIGLWLLTRRTV
jgi:hypothetical protein